MKKIRQCGQRWGGAGAIVRGKDGSYAYIENNLRHMRVVSLAKSLHFGLTYRCRRRDWLGPVDKGLAYVMNWYVVNNV